MVKHSGRHMVSSPFDFRPLATLHADGCVPRGQVDPGVHQGAREGHDEAEGLLSPLLRLGPAVDDLHAERAEAPEIFSGIVERCSLLLRRVISGVW